MKRAVETALSLTEVLVALTIVIVLVWLAFPYVINAHAQPQSRWTLSNMVQLRIATEQMAKDNAQTSKAGWPGDMEGSFSNWTHALVDGNYLSTNDLCHLLSGPGVTVSRGKIPSENSNAILVYAVKETSVPNTVFLTSANFTNTPSGGAKPLSSAKPHGDKVFVILRRDGGIAILQGREAGDTNLIGGFVPLCQ